MATKPEPQPKSDKRLYVGNLSTSVDEYSLMQLCSKLGRIAKLDYLFHKAGPQKGKPRGYAFVEYSSPEEAKRAQQALHDRLFRGRKMMVSFASEQQEVAPTVGTSRPRGPASNDAQKPTAISLLKGGGVAKAPVNRKIAALEAKLAAMRQSKDGLGSGSATASPVGSATPPPVGANAGTGGAQEGGAETSGSGRAGASATASIDHVKAGLPSRPYFSSSEAPREM